MKSASLRNCLLLLALTILPACRWLPDSHAAIPLPDSTPAGEDSVAMPPARGKRAAARPEDWWGWSLGLSSESRAIEDSLRR